MKLSDILSVHCGLVDSIHGFNIVFEASIIEIHRSIIRDNENSVVTDAHLIRSVGIF